MIMSEILSRDDILARKVGGRTELVELPGGGAVRVRGLTRAEGHELRGLEKQGPQEQEIYAVATALVEPKMSEADVRVWFLEGSAGDLQPIAAKINELSGMNPGAGKELTKSVSRRGQRSRN
jgi:hypothetical protein